MLNVACTTQSHLAPVHLLLEHLGPVLRVKGHDLPQRQVRLDPAAVHDGLGRVDVERTGGLLEGLLYGRQALRGLRKRRGSQEVRGVLIYSWVRLLVGRDSASVVIEMAASKHFERLAGLGASVSLPLPCANLGLEARLEMILNGRTEDRWKGARGDCVRGVEYAGLARRRHKVVELPHSFVKQLASHVLGHLHENNELERPHIPAVKTG